MNMIHFWNLIFTMITDKRMTKTNTQKNVNKKGIAYWKVLR